MTYMLDEIHEQPDILESLATREHPGQDALWRAVHERGIDSVSTCARGTSDNAGTFAKYLMEIVGGVPVSTTAASIFTLYEARLDLSQWLVLGVSQSGESTDVIDVLRRSREMGALTAGITNVDGASISSVSDFTFLCNAGEEKSVAATKTYTATLGLFYLLTSAVKKDWSIQSGLKSAADAIRAIFTIEERIAEVVERYRYMDECMVIARGFNQATCQEAALKLAETCYVVAKPYSAADFQHGPIASISEGFPVFLYAPPGRAYAPMLEIADILLEKGAELIVISTEDEILSRAKTPIKLPLGVDEMYSPVVYITVGQLFAQYLALTKGNDPDNPRGLSKITLTM